MWANIYIFIMNSVGIFSLGYKLFTWYLCFMKHAMLNINYKSFIFITSLSRRFNFITLKGVNLKIMTIFPIGCFLQVKRATLTSRSNAQVTELAFRSSTCATEQLIVPMVTTKTLGSALPVRGPLNGRPFVFVTLAMSIN